MDYIKNFEAWKNNKTFSKAIRDELKALDTKKDAKQIEDRFYKELEFGTAGLRGIMGAGTNRMNYLTVGKATAGFGNYLLDKYGKKTCKARGVVICYDTRNNSKYFSEVTAKVLSSLGIRVFLYRSARPIPVLSFSIRTYKAVGGVMITASHNPKDYNGYKVYDETGCQLVPEDADKVTESVNAIKSYESIDFSGEDSLISKVDLTDEYVDEILSQSRLACPKCKANIKVVYTPLHGSGYIPVTKVLKKDGFKNVLVVEQQAKPDGDFPTVVSPNPEDKRALELGIKLAEKEGADVVIGTDPDSDRVGAAARSGDGFKLITGNQMGALLIDYILSNTDLTKIKKPVIVKSIVTSNFGAAIASKHGVSVFNTLTGFKFIGERMNQFETAKETGNSAKAYDYLLGYEESYGYLVGTHARDKDAVVSSMLIAEMAAKLKGEGKTLIDRLEELYGEYGYYLDTQDSYTLSGKEGLEKIQSMMQKLRSAKKPIIDGVSEVVDYKNPVKAEYGFGYHPTADVVIYELDDGSWVAVRPSGTEPKIKIYYSIVGKSESHAQARQQKFHKKITTFLGLE